MTNLLQTESQALKLHIFYAGNYYNNDYFEHKLRSLFSSLKLYKSAMITMLRMQREHLITKEDVDLITKGLYTDNSPLYDHPLYYNEERYQDWFQDWYQRREQFTVFGIGNEHSPTAVRDCWLTSNGPYVSYGNLPTELGGHGHELNEQPCKPWDGIGY